MTSRDEQREAVAIALMRTHGCSGDAVTTPCAYCFGRADTALAAAVPLVEADVLRRVRASIEARRNGMQGPREDSYDNPWNRGYVCGQKEAYEDALAAVTDASREEKP